ncbi:MAG: hypothetical protein CR981_00730 [Proteobacteria bacterium]|nr:MAG: hypothetical protein CR981_00730 [Pseudomonadota bacterium]
MEEQSASTKRRLDKKPSAALIALFCFIIITIVGCLYFLYPQQKPEAPPVIEEQNGVESDGDKPAVIKTIETATGDDAAQQPSVNPRSDNLQKGKEGAEPVYNSDASESSAASPGSEDNTAADNSSLPVPPTVCETAAASVDIFFETLDSRSYIDDFDIQEKSSIYFPKLIQRLVDNPPVVTGETDDLFTVLKNTAHFFRIIGKKNITILKGILDREKPTFEQVLADFYLLTGEGDCLQDRFGLKISDESLYRYAGFFLDTIGGRLYLFRRDSMSRLVVNYYALVIIDQANRDGRNSYGITIADHIDKLIDEIESTNIELQMRDQYLEKLYDMKEAYP